MSGLVWGLAALLLTVAAVVAAWPARAVLRRLDGRRRIPWRAVDLRQLGARGQAFAEESPRRAVIVAALAGGTAGLLLAGPVAGLALAFYGAYGTGPPFVTPAGAGSRRPGPAASTR